MAALGDGSELESSDKRVEEVKFRVIWKKNVYDVTFPLDAKAQKLKEHIQTLTGIPPAMMKLMYRGIVSDEFTLRDLNVITGAKMMVVGSTIDDVITVQSPSPVKPDNIKTNFSDTQESVCEHKEHKKILEKGIPDDIEPGIRYRNDRLPDQPLSGMINKNGSKVRLQFRLDQEQLWIGTKERTEKIPFGSIRKILSEPIKGHEQYHIMALQLGPTELSRYWVYWVPAQYVEAIKDTILGKWQYF